MDNYQIADSISLLAKLMEIHGENAFKIKSYTSAAFNIEKLQIQLSSVNPNTIASIQGIGTSTAQKIVELLSTGKIESLENFLRQTPEGILEMLQIKGIGPKKINTIWKEMEIETIGELLYACKENRLKLYKGFGEKTQQNVISAIEFYFAHKGSHLYASITPIAHTVHELLKKLFPKTTISIVGSIPRQLEVIHQLEYLIEAPLEEVAAELVRVSEFRIVEKYHAHIELITMDGLQMIVYVSSPSNSIETLVRLNSSDEFWKALEKITTLNKGATTEAAFFKDKGLPFIPAYLRESPSLIETIKDSSLPAIITKEDIKGIIHCHSNWSDGSNTIEEIAIAAQKMGLEYLAISDHSKAAFYAQGLSEEKIIAQHQYIDELNKKLHPFKIFKSIECDILSDGNLDYSNTVLAGFDLVIASVHSNLKMNEEKAMQRLLKAIENPYTSILGHLTGRLLLSRPGYPVNHKKIIDACSANHVAIELNAHPIRLDIDWRHIAYALEKNVLISINPDAHELSGLTDTQYGVLVAQKAMLTKEQNLSSFGLSEFEAYLKKIKTIKSI